MNKNDEIKLTVTALTSQGSGIGRYKDMAVFVDGSAVGDELLVHIIKVKKNYAIGIIKKIIKPSKDRIISDCDAFERCGGCSYRHITYEAELEGKKQRVQDALTRIGGIDIDVNEILSVKNIAGYRNKAQYPVGLSDDGKLLIGFYSKRSHRIVDCRNCRLQPAEFEKILDVIAHFVSENPITVYDEKTGRGLLRHIYLRKARITGQIMVCLVINGNSLPKKDRLIEALTKENSNIASIVININKAETNVILGDECVTIYGSDYIEDELCSLKFRISPLSFYQVNPEGTELLYSKAREFANLDGYQTVLDLYCGTGTIGLTMAKKAKKLIGVEIIPDAIENAKMNAEINNIKNAEFFCGDASAAAKRLADDGIRPNVVILDPPRKGCSEDVIKAVCDMAPERVVYVSCDPATLARDCKIFAELGYDVTKATAVDMFPRTVHVETVVLLTKVH